MTDIFEEMERGDVSLNFNGEMLQYGYVVYPSRLVIHCCQKTHEIPIEGDDLSRHLIREHVLTAIQQKDLSPCTGQGSLP